MIKAGPDDRIYFADKFATLIDALEANGISTAEVLQSIGLMRAAFSSPATRISLNQMLDLICAVAGLSTDRYFAFRTGLRFHVSSFGMYGFAILSSTNFRRTVHFAQKYQELAFPLGKITFKEEGERSAWIIDAIAHPRVDARTYRLLVEAQAGMLQTIHRDVMGQSFAAREIQVRYGAPADAQSYADTFGCRVVFGQPDNKFIFDSTWLDSQPDLGNEITYALMVKLCDEMLEEMQLHIGLAGKVRQFILVNVMRPTSFEAIARHLHLTARTLRRKLNEEKTSFRKLVDELRMHVAIKYLRDTDLTIDEIAYALGFSDPANFRRAFRRWTKGSPQEIRESHRGP